MMRIPRGRRDASGDLHCDGTCGQLIDEFNEFITRRQATMAAEGNQYLDRYHQSYFDVTPHSYVKVLESMAKDVVVVQEGPEGMEVGINVIAMNVAIEFGLFLTERKVARDIIKAKECSELAAMLGASHGAIVVADAAGYREEAI